MIDSSMLMFAFRTLITSSTQLQHAKDLLAAYKHGQLKQMTPELWRAKKVVDATLHPGITI